MISHHYRVLEIGMREHRRRKVLIDFDEEGYGLLSSFIEEEGGQFFAEICGMLEDVLEGRTSSQVFRGNLMTAYISRLTTVITDEGVLDGKPCAVDTRELRTLLGEWKEYTE